MDIGFGAQNQIIGQMVNKVNSLENYAGHNFKFFASVLSKN